MADEVLLTTDEAAALMRLAPETLKKWRRTKQGPPYASLGRRVVYRRRDVQSFIDDHFDRRK